MRLLRCLALLLVSTSLWSQQFGTLKVYISPPPETIMIDDVELKFGNSIDLKPGKYFLRAWAPNKELLDTIVEVKAGTVTSFFHRLEPSKEYLEQTELMAQYSKQKGFRLAIPIMTTTLIAGSLVYTYIQGSEARDEALQLYDEYLYANTNLDRAANDYVSARNSYRSYVTAYYIEWGLMAVSSYYLYKGIQWARKNKEPVFDTPKNPLVLNGLGMNRDAFGNYTVGLSFNLGR